MPKKKNPKKKNAKNKKTNNIPKPNPHPNPPIQPNQNPNPLIPLPIFFGYSDSDDDFDYPFDSDDEEYYDDYTDPFHRFHQIDEMNYIPFPFSEETDEDDEEEPPISAFEVVEDLDSFVTTGGDNTRQALLKLPLDIFLEIISRLPIKPLAVGRCVCKTWRQVIHHPRFIQLHHIKATKQSQISNSPTSLLLHLSISFMLEHKESYPRDKNFSEIHFLECGKDDGFDNGVVATPEFCPSELVFKPSALKFDVLGSCNGLICIGEAYKGDPIYVSNPVIGEYDMLPGYEKEAFHGIVSGFGFDEVRNEYKVIRMVYGFDFEKFSGYIMEAEVYTLGSGKWRKLGNVPYPFCKKSMPVSVNGALHWLTTEYFNGLNLETVVAFDVGTEVLRVVPPPPGFTPCCEYDCELQLGGLGGNLCLFDHSYHQCDVWIMKDYGVERSWTKEYVISRKIPGLEFRFDEVDLKPVTLMKNGDILLEVNNEALVCYDPVKKSFSKLQVQKIPSKFEVITHAGSFISLKDIVGPATSKHSGNTRRKWYRTFRPISSQRPIEDEILNYQLNCLWLGNQ